jgi:proteic killer suppression protein
LIAKVILTKKAFKDLSKAPPFIADKFDNWTEAIEESGIDEVRKISGYHDEPLLGKRKGFRSIRLSRSYRAIYKISDGCIKFVEVCEVNKHDY